MNPDELSILIKLLTILVVFTGLNLLAIVVYGYKVIKFVNRIEWRTNMMWYRFSKDTGISDGDK